ncbi:hypothetical protein OH76DRAFT_880468 [Lentinus brumalis]|uniref:Uncharacterized protein n=1 Tax=Lentinus brumalis TaxID=2498619 RepID=A0A371DRU2_9APHY|nr:hypothetical protein OH76DRAFT_880468 [Polyporus brumalis]
MCGVGLGPERERERQSEDMFRPVWLPAWSTTLQADSTRTSSSQEAACACPSGPGCLCRVVVALSIVSSRARLFLCSWRLSDPSQMRPPVQIPTKVESSNLWPLAYRRIRCVTTRVTDSTLSPLGIRLTGLSTCRKDGPRQHSFLSHIGSSMYS